MQAVRKSERSSPRAERNPREAAFSIDGQRFSVSPIQPGLHVVSTPIGNLRDITIRALETLAGADIVLCEDTRHTARLLNHYAISAKTLSYHEHNAASRRKEVLAMLDDGACLALVSDAGTPLVSDPGFKLVDAALNEGHAVTAVPGASAVLAALTVSGQPSDAFHFIGFLPPKAGRKRAAIESLKTVPGSLVLYESPNRLTETLSLLNAILGDRPATVARELTKRYETTYRATLAELVEQFSALDAPLKGEIVIIVGAAGAGHEGNALDIAAGDLDDRMVPLADEIGASRAASELARATGAPRRAIYDRILHLRRQSGE